MKRNIFLILSLIFSINCLGAAEHKPADDVPVLSPEQSAALVAMADGSPEDLQIASADMFAKPKKITVCFPKLGQDPEEAPKITFEGIPLQRLNSGGFFDGFEDITVPLLNKKKETFELILGFLSSF